ncbi:MGMT family protein [Actinomycetes bacterium M1A6_2h]
MNDEYEAFSARVLDLVDRIPPGRVMSYGQIAEVLEHRGPRAVGNVMARDGDSVTWWRVVRADGTLPPHLVIEAQEHWIAEETPMRRGIVDMDKARWWPEDPQTAIEPTSSNSSIRSAGTGRENR